MTTKERVLAYFEEWAGECGNAANRCRCESYSYQIEDGSAETIYSILPMDSRNNIKWFVPGCNDFEWELAARILQIDNPWRLTTKELPDEGVTVLCTLGRRLYWVASRKAGEWWYSDGNIAPHPWKWMPIPDSLE